MAILRYREREGDYVEREFFKKEVVRLGSSQDSDIVLSEEQKVASHHAAVIFSRIRHLYILVNLTRQPTLVNGRSIVSLRVLRHMDQIQLGQAQLTIRELYMKRLLSKDARRWCVFCRQKLEIGDAILSCPHCSATYHYLCGLSNPACGTHGCAYPFIEYAIDALAPWVTAEPDLREPSDLVKNRVLCKAGERIDILPFQYTNNAVYCPSSTCHWPFHWNCWIKLQNCPNPECGYDIQGLLSRVFRQETLAD